jgi:uncharacterized protein DUF6457
MAQATEGGDVNRDQWIAAFAERIGAEAPSAEEIDSLLELAATAAHASHRTAAPLACWLGGLSGKSLAELNAIAEEISPGDE